MSTAALSDSLAAALRREAAGELIRWTGRPDPARTFWISSLIWIFAIPWTAFSGFMTAVIVGVAIGSGTPAPAPFNGAWGVAGIAVALMFMTPFVVVGLGMMSAPVLAWLKAHRTIYGATDQRLIVISLFRGTTTVKSIWLERIVSIERQEKSDGSGSLKLLLGSRRDSDGDLVQEAESIPVVPDVRRLEAVLLAGRRSGPAVQP